MGIEKIGLFGGSFDPIHLGHLQIAKDLNEVLHLDRFIFVPALTAPHKKEGSKVSEHHRYTMVQQAVNECKFGEVSRVEIERGGLSFSIDTVLHYQHRYPQAQIFFFIGSDSLTHFDSWYRVADLLNACQVVTFVRPGYGLLKSRIDEMKLTREQKDCLFEKRVTISEIAISSTQVRDAIQTGNPFNHLVPACVKNYIVDNSIYES
ncbi:MAG: nicotinate (nicotinamide) nucleotide adenylyltransferase [Kiritimatiellaceae bacterium]|nr:nicotinate (nicotinamide) nucleotide adenylyltransferase [Kiritimatiellaceae bacterium]